MESYGVKMIDVFVLPVLSSSTGASAGISAFSHDLVETRGWFPLMQ